MADITYNKDNTRIEITSLSNNIFAIQIMSYKDSYDNDPKVQEIVVDIKNECVMTGNMTKILLNVIKTKEGDK